LVFAARQGEAGGLNLWPLEPVPTTYERQWPAGQGLARARNFDPIFAPDGSVVVASTRDRAVGN